MKTSPIPPAEYQPPTYVGVFMGTAILLVIAGVVLLFMSLVKGNISFAPVGCFLAALVQWFYGQMANDLGRAAWQSARLAYELRPIIYEINEQAAEREQREAKAREEREAEIRRVVVARHLAGKAEPEDE